MAKRDKILLVDDQENLLSALKRQLRGRYDVLTANGGKAALEIFDTEDSIAVCICDMRMPGMTGLEVLAAMKERAPETVRMMLTGNADQATAADAINSGNIFRFLSKPCEPEDLMDGIDAGIAQYRLIMAERELLEHTLAGSVKLLSDLMGFMDFEAGNDADRMRLWARKLARQIKMPRPWELDFACMLAPLGRISIPAEIADKVWRNEELTPIENNIVTRAPEVARDLLANIPRMSGAADAVYYQDKNFDGSGFPENNLAGTEVPLAGRVLHVLKGIAAATKSRAPTKKVIDHLGSMKGCFDPDILAAANACLAVSEEDADDAYLELSEDLPLSLLKTGQELLVDITYEDGRLLLAKRTVLTDLHIERLRALSKSHAVNEPIKVVTHTNRPSA